MYAHKRNRTESQVELSQFFFDLAHSTQSTAQARFFLVRPSSENPAEKKMKHAMSRKKELQDIVPFARSQLRALPLYSHKLKVLDMTQPPAPANAATGPSDPTAAAARNNAEAELHRLRTACAGLSTRLHALARTRRQLTAQVSILAVEAVEAGCRGELWITHEGKSNESKFHRVVRSSEIACGRERGELAARAEEEEMGSSGGGSAGGGSGGSGAKRKGTSPTNNGSKAGGGAAGSDQHSPSSSSSEVGHKLCCVPGCTKKEQGKWYGKMW